MTLYPGVDFWWMHIFPRLDIWDLNKLYNTHPDFRPMIESYTCWDKKYEWIFESDYVVPQTTPGFQRIFRRFDAAPHVWGPISAKPLEKLPKTMKLFTRDWDNHLLTHVLSPAPIRTEDLGLILQFISEKAVRCEDNVVKNYVTSGVLEPLERDGEYGSGNEEARGVKNMDFWVNPFFDETGNSYYVDDSHIHHFEGGMSKAPITRCPGEIVIQNAICAYRLVRNEGIWELTERWINDKPCPHLGFTHRIKCEFRHQGHVGHYCLDLTDRELAILKDTRRMIHPQRMVGNWKKHRNFPDGLQRINAKDAYIYATSGMTLYHQRVRGRDDAVTETNFQNTILAADFLGVFVLVLIKGHGILFTRARGLEFDYRVMVPERLFPKPMVSFAFLHNEIVMLLSKDGEVYMFESRRFHDGVVTHVPFPAKIKTLHRHQHKCEMVDQGEGIWTCRGKRYSSTPFPSGCLALGEDGLVYYYSCDSKRVLCKPVPGLEDIVNIVTGNDAVIALDSLGILYFLGAAVALPPGMGLCAPSNYIVNTPKVMGPDMSPNLDKLWENPRHVFTEGEDACFLLEKY